MTGLLREALRRSPLADAEEQEFQRDLDAPSADDDEKRAPGVDEGDEDGRGRLSYREAIGSFLTPRQEGEEG